MAIDTRPDLTPSRLLILMATGTFVRQILTARAAVEAARRYEFFIRYNILHISNASQSDDAGCYKSSYVPKYKRAYRFLFSKCRGLTDANPTTKLRNYYGILTIKRGDLR